MNYDFHELVDIEFEELVRDLLQAEMGIHLESFKRGADRGIDMRYLAAEGGSVVVQCKHWRGSGFSKLLSQMRREESPKIQSLQPARYFLATSISLTEGQVEKLRAATGLESMRSGDILGQEALNNLIRKHPTVERNHYKLWLSSATVLDRILHSDIHNLTDMKIREIKERLPMLVHVSAAREVRELLRSHRCCVITGDPGIGKSTLADILLLEFAAEGFEPVVMRQLGDGLAAFKPTKAQIFLYDDFLGATSLTDSILRREDSNLPTFLRAIESSKVHLFILTARNYMLAQAQALSERHSRLDVNPRKYVLALTRLNRSDRARILYNHIYHSILPREYAHELLKSRGYLKIIDHPDYSPRIIEYMTTRVAELSIPAGEYVSTFLRNLENPEELWSYMIDRQISPVEKDVLLTLATFPRSCSLEALRRAVMDKIGSDAELKSALKNLEGSVTQTTVDAAQAVSIDFKNASIRDFLRSRIGADQLLLRRLAEHAVFTDQVVHLATMVQPAKDMDGLGEIIREAASRCCGNCVDFKVERRIGKDAYTWSHTSVVPLPYEAAKVTEVIATISATEADRYLSEIQSNLIDSLDEDLTDIADWLGLFAVKAGKVVGLEILPELVEELARVALRIFQEREQYDYRLLRCIVALATLCGQGARFTDNNIKGELLGVLDNHAEDIAWTIIEEEGDLEELTVAAGLLDEVERLLEADFDCCSHYIWEHISEVMADDEANAPYETPKRRDPYPSRDMTDSDIEALFTHLLSSSRLVYL